MLQGWWYKYKERDDYIHCYLRNKNIIIQTKRVNSVERKRTAKIQKKKKKKKNIIRDLFGNINKKKKKNKILN